jgi:triphosphoribosyl-dephospho-CoA synthetase
MPRCQSCEILLAQLEYERAQKEKFQDLLLRRTGDLLAGTNPEDTQVVLDTDKPVHKARTLSALKNRVETHLSAKAAVLNTAGTVTELTEAEKLFEASIQGLKNDAPIQ